MRQAEAYRSFKTPANIVTKKGLPNKYFGRPFNLTLRFNYIIFLRRVCILQLLHLEMLRYHTLQFCLAMPCLVLLR